MTGGLPNRRAEELSYNPADDQLIRFGSISGILYAPKTIITVIPTQQSMSLGIVMAMKRLALLLMWSTCVAAPSQSTTVSFSGAVVNLCVLTLSTPGVLAPSATGTMLGSEESGGVNAALTVVATGTNPTLSFAVPQVSGPAASTTSATKEIAYTAAAGGSQGYTAASSTFSMSRLTDTLTVKGRVTNTNGFVSGTYGLATTVTCQQ